MSDKLYSIESSTRFSESILWQLNRDYYQSVGIDAWSKGEVPHQITSNSLVGKTYAELILGFLCDLSDQGSTDEKVYILELGAGHGRLAFHILKHLEKLVSLTDQDLPPYCFVISDIGEKNLSFFRDHPQLKTYYESGVLDYAYYDAINGKEIHLRYADKIIKTGQLNQALFVLANYFFDSIPNDLIHIEQNKLSLCSIAIESTQNPATSKDEKNIGDLKFSYIDHEIDHSFYQDQASKEILANYILNLKDTYILYPHNSLKCINNLRSLSQKGLMLVSMDKGYHRLTELDNMVNPELVKHGSFSVWVNFHALGSYCLKHKGKTLYTDNASYNLQMCGFLFLENAESYKNTNSAYQRFVNDFGPEDYNNIKKLSSDHIQKMPLPQLLTLLRLSSYDSSMFIKLLPRIKEIIKEISYIDREKIANILPLIWSYYFNINEKENLALIIAGIYFDLGHYAKAVTYYQYSADTYGLEMDTCYNKILCYYQLREDVKFSEALEEARRMFPGSELIVKLDALDLGAA